MKKTFAILLSIVLMLSLAVPAMAEGETYTITVPNTDSHTYEIYQIFTGDYAEVNGNRILSNLVWGKNGIGYVTDAETQAKVPAAVLDEIQKAGGTDAEKLAVILKYVNLESSAFDEVTGANAAEVAPGYYLLKDKGTLNGDDAYTTYIVKVVDHVVITRKAAKPTVDKQVQDEVDDKDFNSTDNAGWGETADHEINETFQFKLIATIPADEDFAAYKTYKVVFNDTMSAGITFESIVSVKVNDGDVAAEDYDCTATEGMTDGKWTLTIADIKKYDANLADGATVEVIYKAHLNENAVVGNKDENLNTVYLEYSNNPNWNGTGTEETGKTEEDTVWVFTYQVDVTKVDGADEKTKLPGAEFKLRNAENKWVVVDENGKVSNWVETEAEGSVVTSNDEGKFAIIGLDAGTYYLKEMKAPAGYNLLSDEITVTIEAAHKETAVDAAETVFTEDSKTEITVENNAGATLPETGGIGTTVFYIVGGVMVAAAVVLLVTKKRMSAEG